MFDHDAHEGLDSSPREVKDGVRSWWTPERIDLLGWLEENAPALVPIYEGALSLAMRDSFPGRVHFLAHAIREIRGRLPVILGTEIKRRDADYRYLVDQIRDKWIDEKLPRDGRLLSSGGSAPSDSGPELPDVSIDFLRSVGRLIEEHTAAEKNRTARDRAGFSAFGDMGISPSHVIKNWHSLYPDAHKFAHVADKPRRSEDDAAWVENFFKFEKALMSFSKPSYENMDDIDRLLERVNK